MGAPFSRCALCLLCVCWERAGIGGFRLGLEPLGGRCVFVSELDEAAQETYALNFPLSPDNGSGRGEWQEVRAGDITGVYGHEVPYCDLLTGGVCM